MAEFLLFVAAMCAAYGVIVVLPEAYDAWIATAREAGRAMHEGRLVDAERQRALRAMHDWMVWLLTGGVSSDMDFGLAMFIEGLRDPGDE